jgi:pilus assembly protein CpaB
MGDYLFDKEGRDPSLEALERNLSLFKFDLAPPALPEAAAPARAGRVREWRGPTFSTRRLPLVAAIGLSLIAGVVSYSAIKRQESAVRRGWNLVPVVVAAVDISEGTELTMEMIATRAIPEQFVTASVVKPDSAAYVLNQKVLVPVQPGDPLLWSQFASSRAAERLSSKVQRKARALAIEAKATSAVGGWVRPSDHVDLIGTFKDPTSGEQVAVTLMQNVIVLSTGKITSDTNVNLLSESERGYNHVSLMVLPEEAEQLVLAQELGALTMSLRNEDDLDELQDRGRATINTLLSGERTRVLQQKRFNTIQVIRGNQKP